MFAKKCPSCGATLGNYAYADACPHCSAVLIGNRALAPLEIKVAKVQSWPVRAFFRVRDFVES